MSTHVLLVDDEPDFVELMAHGLRANGFECSGAFSGMEGLEKARRLSPDVVVLDIMLPDLDGFTICEILRRDPANRRMSVLMATCLGGQMSRLNGLSAGADGYLTKPVTIPALVTSIRDLIRRRCAVSSTTD